MAVGPQKGDTGKGMNETRTKAESFFLEVLSDAMKGRKSNGGEELLPETWTELFRISREQHLLPLIYDAVSGSQAAKKCTEYAAARREAIKEASLQEMKTQELFMLLRRLRETGPEPLVVKGLVCRSLYPKPGLRWSGDEDLFVPAEVGEDVHERLLACGWIPAEPEADGTDPHETPYMLAGKPLHIELHKTLFPEDSAEYGDLNRFFAGAWERAVTLTIDGQPIRTLAYTDHLFYLICHAFKHFLHSGVGVRQLCDILMFSKQWGERIDWSDVKKKSGEAHIEGFTAALFQIGEKYLGFDLGAMGCPAVWRELELELEPLLSDMLEGGVYGDSSLSRMHSSTITLSAVSADRQGKASSHGVLRSLFPSAKMLSSRYPWLKDKPYLLPAAWAARIWRYGRESAGAQNNSASESIRIGNERVELLKRYGIIE